jgi:hypothetical protein
MVIDTNSIVFDFKNCISGKDISDDIKETELYYMYFNDDEVGYVTDVNVRRYFVLHNFHKGVMYVNYTYKTFDKSGKQIRGAHKVSSKWYIEKQNGRWLVYDIDENP